MSSARRILFLEPVGERGGAEVVLLELLVHLDRARFEPHVALLSDGPLASELAGLAASVTVFPRHRVREVFSTLATIRGLAALVRRLRVGLIHTQGTKTHLYGGAVRALTGVPELWHIYDPPPRTPGWIDRIVTRIRTDAVLFISEGPRRAFGQLMDTGAATVVHPGIRPAPDPGPEVLGPVLARLGILQDAPLVLQVSRLQAFKGHETLVAAIATLATRYPDLHVVMAGGTLFGLEEEYPARVRAAIRAAGLEGRVKLAGWLSDTELAALFHHATCLCYAEHVGPYSLVILEAMAAGRPVVASRTEGAEILVEPGKTGWLVPPADPQALSEAIGEVLADPERARAMGAAGRARQEKQFTAAAMAHAISELYDRLAVHA